MGRAEPRTGDAAVGKAWGKGEFWGCCGPRAARESCCPLVGSGQSLTTYPPPTPAIPGAPPGCQADIPVPPSRLGGDHGYADAPLPVSQPHGSPAGQL